jgi:exopolysaccharide biosynthesis polyprenyl glycosylphosphotransferase
MSQREKSTAEGQGRPTVKRNRFPFRRRRTDAVLLVLDLLVLIGALSAFSDSLFRAVLEALIVVIVIEMAGGYRAQIMLSSLDDLPRLAGTSIIAVFLATILLETDASIQRALFVSAYVIAVLFVIRIVYYALRRRHRRRSIKARSRTVIVGGGVVAAELLESIAEFPELGLEPIVVVDADPLFGADQLSVPVIAGRSLREVVETESIETVIVAFRHEPDSGLVSPLRECDHLDCEIFIVPRLFEFVHLNSDMDRIHTIPLIRVRRNIYRTWLWHSKRVFDFTTALTALLLLSPILGLTALAVYFSDRRSPIIFSQVRVGRNGDEFTLYKFRSMRSVAATTSDTDWNSQQTNRVNAVGRLIRKTSIDELPQLWNVVRGNMSLVGPRPERPHFVEQFKESVPSYRDRHRVNVGLTGWAAIHGLRGDTSIDDRAIYDNFYIENWSVWLDIKIVLLTIGAVLRGTGS